jgi:hypothetical protein
MEASRDGGGGNQASRCSSTTGIKRVLLFKGLII